MIEIEYVDRSTRKSHENIFSDFYENQKSLFPNLCSHCNSSEICSNRPVSSRLTPFSSIGAGILLIIGDNSVNAASDVVTEWMH